MKIASLVIASISLAVLAACGQKAAETPATESASTPPVAAAPAAAAPAENKVGKTVFGNTCSMCHAAGVAGAPKPGDKADWGPRIAQGMDTLYKHAMEGFNGAKGQMPARGGAPALTDDEVKAGVNYMVDQSR
ncbi:c-type cytochrome [Undibacterium oligocarboniphilum]|uniref:Cytochrome c5 family protein n=1 Tax=Undibacterium oligocarboniphilum TaxID=666702 RepID=A0A850QF55_9BURK|nr:c-type cytochrome [Undibacterium oligocarboniphilum]MBC3869941.1 cytochrome c5 family protein [Undibacterium oligocarboniphilum]NVO77557.1 cytochrome c5 family protein [Undibacterium oligocarboniphilum]